MPTRTARTTLLSKSALSGALSGALGALLAASAARAAPAGLTIPQGVTHAPTVTSSGSTTSVQLNQSRTVIDWKSFNVAKGETLDFVFGSNNGIVLNRTTGTATINGALNGCVVTCNVIGGSVWIYAPNGVLFGSGARVNVGSLLATTTPLSNVTDFLSGKTDFTFQGGTGFGKVQAAAGAELAARGGALALIAPEVDVQAGAKLTAAQTVLLGAAQNFRIHFDESAGGDLDLIDFEVPTSALQDGSVSATPLSVNGQVAGGSVVMAAVSRPSVMNALISLGGQVTATSAKAGEGGEIILTASGAPSTTTVSGALAASRSVSLQAQDGGALNVSGSITARDAAGQGGTILVGGAGTGSATLAAGGLLDAASTGASLVGGKVDATAANLDVEGSVAAGGPAGGGTIRLGGGAHGSDATIADAASTTIGTGATIDASATASGSGGQVTVWSNTDTQFAGTITARGGAQGGDGGAVEVSGGYLDYRGLTDLRAPHGAVGALLLDPADINITLDTAAGQGGPDFVPPASGDPSSLSVAAINTALLTSKVTVTAGAGGQITFTDEKNANALSQYTFAGSLLGTALTFSAPGGFSFDPALPISSTGLALTFTTTSAFQLGGGSISTNGGALSITGAGLSLGSGKLSTVPPLGGAGTLSLDAGSGVLTLDGVVSAGASGAVSLSGGSIAQPSGSLAAGSLQLTAVGAGGTIVLNQTGNMFATLTSAKGSAGMTLSDGEDLTISAAPATGGLDQITVAGKVSFPAAVTLNENLDISASDGAEFSGALDGAKALSVTGGKTIFDDVVGGSTPLASISLASSTVNTGAVSTSGPLGLGAATFTKDLTLTSSGGVVRATSLDGAHKLTIAGDASLGDVGQTSAPTSLSVSGATTLNGAVTASGGVQLQAVTLAGTSSVTSTGGSIVFGGALDGGFGLTTSATAAGQSTSFATVGAKTALASLTTNGAVTTNGAITVDGAVEFKNAVTLAADTPVTSNTGSVLFDASVDGAHGLTATATTSGQSVVLNAVGQTTPLASLTTHGATTLNADVATTSGITFNDGLTLAKTVSVTSGAGSVTFGGGVDGDFGLTVSATTAGQSTRFNAVGATTPLASLTTNGAVQASGAMVVDGKIDFAGAFTLVGATSVTSNAGSVVFGGAVDGGYGLTASATTSGQDVSLQAVGQTTPLASLTTYGATTAGANINATGTIRFNDALTLASAVTATSSAGSVAFAGAVDGGFDLTASAVTAGQGVSLQAVGQTTPLASLTTHGATTASADITTAGTIRFNDALTLGGDVVATSNAGSIVFGGAVDGDFALTASAATAGQTVSLGAVGATTALASLSVTGAANTNGAITANDFIEFKNSVTLTGATSVTSNTGPIDFDSSIDGGYALTASATMTGEGVALHAVGQGAALASLTVHGAATTNGAIQAGGDIAFDGGLTLGADTSVTSTGGAITFTSTVDGPAALKTSTAAGQASRFQGAVGQASPLTSLTVHGPAEVGGSITATNAIAFDGAVTLTGAATITSQAKGVGFSSTVDGPFALTTASASGATTQFGGAVGQLQALGSVTTQGTTSLAGSLHAVQGVDFQGGLLLAASGVIQSDKAGIHFEGALDGPYALTLSAPQAVVLAAVGQTTPLAGLDVTGPATLTADVAVSGTATLGAATTLSRPGGGLITLAADGVDVQSVASDPTNLTGLFVNSTGSFAAHGVLGGGGVALPQLAVSAPSASFAAGNDVAVLAIDLTAAGPLVFDNGANALKIGAVAGVSGVTTNASSATITAGAITVDAAVATTSAPVGGGGVDRLTLSGSGLTLTSAAALTATAMELDASGAAGVVQQGGSLTTATLSGQAAGPVTLTSSANAIGTVSGLKTSAGGAISLITSGPLTVGAGGLVADGDLTVQLSGASAGLTLSGDVGGQAVSLTAPGVIQQMSGRLSAASLTAAGSAILLQDASNTVAAVGAAGLVSSGAAAGLGDVRLTTTLGLTASGPVTASNGAVSLQAASLSLGAVQADGQVSLNATGGDLILNGTVQGGGAGPQVALDAYGKVQELGGAVNADQATVTGASVDLEGANAVNSLGASSASTGDFTFVNTKGLSVNALTLAGDLTLTAASGDLVLNQAVIVPSSATLTARAGALSTAGVQVGGDYTITAASFAAGALSPVFTGPASDFTIEKTAGDLDLAAIDALTTPDALKVAVDAGALTDSSGATLRAASFDASANSVTLGSVKTSGDLALTASPRGASGAASDITLNGLLTVGQTATLSATGAIRESGPAAPGVSAQTLDAKAGQAISLTGQNHIAVVSRLQGGAGASLVDIYTAATPAASALQLSDAASGSGDLFVSNTGGVVLKTAISQAANRVTLNAAAGSVTQDAGAAITAKTLDVSANGVGLDQAGNMVSFASLVDTGSSGLAFRDAATGALAADTAAAVEFSSGGTISVSTAGDLQLTQAVSGTTVGLASAGEVSQAAAGSISASNLSVSAAKSVDLSAGANNQVAVLASLTDAAGDAAGVRFVGMSATPLAVGLAASPAGTVAVDGGAGGVELANRGGLQLLNDVHAGAAGGGQLIQLAASGGDILGVGGAVVGGRLSVSAPTGRIDLRAGGDSFASLDTLTAGRGAQVFDAVGELTVGAVTAGEGDLSLHTSGGLGLTGAVSAGDATHLQTVSLTADAGEITQTATGLITASTLSAVGGAGVSLGQGNAVSTVSLAQDTGASGVGVTLQSTRALTVDAAIGGAGNVTLIAGGDLRLAGAGVDASGHTASLTAAGALSQAASAPVKAAVLTGQAQSIDLSTAGNLIATVDALTATSGAFKLNDLTALQLADGVSASSITLNDTASITQAKGGVVTTDALSASATGGVVLDQANQIGALAEVVNSGARGVVINNASTALFTVHDVNAGAGDLVLSTQGAASLTGALVAGAAGGSQTISLTSGGALAQQMGASLTAGRLTGSSQAGFQADQGANAFALAGPISANGDLVLTDSVALTVDGALQATGGALRLTPAALSVTSAGSLTAASLRVDAAGDITLAGQATIDDAAVLNTGGALTETGSIAAGSFGATAANGISLPTLKTRTLTGLTNSTAGDISIQLVSAAVTSAGISDAAGAVSVLQPGGSLAFTGAVSAKGLLTLTSGGALRGVSAVSSTGAVELTGAGVDFTGAGAGLVSAQTDVAVQAGSGAASFQDLSAATGDVHVTAGPIGVAGTLRVGRDLALVGSDYTGHVLSPVFAPGTGRDFLLTDTAGGLTFTSLSAPRNIVVLATDPRTGDSAPVVGGSVTSAAGDISITGTSVSLSGPVSALTGDVTLDASAGVVGLSGLLQAGPSVQITATGAVVESGAGAIQAGRLSAAAGTGIDLGGANVVAKVDELANSGAGGVLYTSAAAATKLGAATTGGGDLVLTSTGGALQLDTDLTSPGAIRIAAKGALAGDALSAQGGALSVQASGITLTGAANASTDVRLDAGAGAASLQDVSAKTGSLTLLGGAITTADLSAATDLQVSGTGTVSLGQVGAASGALSLSGATLQFTSASAGFTATLQSAGALSFNDLTSAGDLAITAGGLLDATSVSATAGGVTLTAAAANVHTVSASGTLSATTTSGDLSVADLSAGGDAVLQVAGGLGVDTVSVKGDLTLNADGAATLTQASAGGALHSVVGQGLQIGALRVGGSADVTAGALTLASTQIGGDAQLSSAGAAALTSFATAGSLGLKVAGALTGGSVSSVGPATVNAGSLGLTTLQTTGKGSMLSATTGGDLTATTLASAGDLGLQAGGAASVSTLTAAGAATGKITGALMVAALTSGGGATLSAQSMDLATANVGGNAGLTSTADTVLTSFTSAGALQVQAGGALRGETSGHGVVASGGPTTVNAGSIDLDTLQTTGSSSALAATTQGDASVLTLASAGDLTLNGGGAVTATKLSAAGALTATAADALTVNTLSVGGAASLSAQSIDLATATVGGKAALTTAADLRLGDLTAGDAVQLQAGGAASASTISTGASLTAKVANALTVGSLASVGDTTLSAQSIDLATANVGGNAGLTSTADTVLTSFTSAGALQVQAGGALRGETSGHGVVASGGPTTVNAGSVDLDTLQTTGAGSALSATAAADMSVLTLASAGDLAIQVGGAGSIAQLTTARGLNAKVTGLLTVSGVQAGGYATVSAGLIDFTTATVGGNANLTSVGDTVLTRFTTGAALQIKAGGALRGEATGHGVVASGGPATVNAGSIDLDTLQTTGSGSALSATTQDDASVLTLASKGDLTLSGGGAVTVSKISAGASLTATVVKVLTVGSLVSVGDTTLSAQSIDLATADVGGNASLTSVGDTVLTRFTAGGASKVQAGGALRGETSGAGVVASTGPATVNAGRIDLDTLKTTGSGAALSAAAEGDVSLLTLASAGDLTLQTGGATRVLTLTATRAVSADVGTSLTVGALTSGGKASLSAQSLDLTNTQIGGDAQLSSAGAAALTSFATAGSLGLKVAGALTGVSVSSVGPATVNAGSLGLTTLQTTGKGSMLSATTGGDLTATTLASAGDLGLQAGGAASVSTLTAAGAATGKITGALTIAALTSGGDATLSAQAMDLATASVGGNASLTTVGDTVLTSFTSSGALQVQAGGALRGETSGHGVVVSGGPTTVNAGSVNLDTLQTTGAGSALAATTQGDASVLTLASAGDLTLNGDGAVTVTKLSAAGALTATAADALTVNTLSVGGDASLSAQSIDLAATNIGGAANLASTGDTLLTSFTAAGALQLQAGGALRGETSGHGVVASGGPATVNAKSIDLDTLQTTGKGSALSATTQGDMALLTLASAGDLAIQAGGGASMSQLTAAGAFNAKVTGAVTASGLQAGGDATVSAGSLDFATATVGGNASLTSVGDTVLTSFGSAGALQLQAGGALRGETSGHGVVASGGPATVTAGSVDLDTLQTTGSGSALAATTQGDASVLTLASAGDLTLNGGGTVTVAKMTAAGVLAATAANALTVNALSVGGDASLSAQSIDLATANVGGAATLASTGDTVLTSFTAAGALQVQAGGALRGETGGAGAVASGGSATIKAASLDLATLIAGSDLSLDVQADAAAGVLGAGRDFTATTGGGLTVSTLTAARDLALTSGDGVTVTTLGAGRDANLSAGGDIALGQVSSGGSLTATSGGRFTAQAMTVGADGAVTAQGAISYADARTGGGLALASQAGDVSGLATTVGANLQVQAAGAASLTGVVTGQGGDVSVAANRIVLGAPSGPAGAADVLTTGASTTVELAATGPLSVDVLGPATLTKVTAGGDLSLATTGGDLTAASVTAGGGFSVSAQGASARLGVLSLSGVGPATIQAGTDLVMGAGVVGAGASTLIVAPLRLLTVSAGRDVLIAYTDAVSLASVAAGRNLSIASAAGALDLPSLAAGGSAALSAGTGVALGTANTGASLAAQALDGDARLDSATVGGDLSLSAVGGAAALRTVSMTGAQPGARTLTVSATGEASIGATADGAAGGALSLADPARTQVYVLSTGGVGAAARVDVTGDAHVTQVASTSGDVFVRTPGALVGAPAAGPLFSAAGNLAVTTGAGASLGGQSAIGGDAVLAIGGALSLNALSARTVNLTATDLSLSGALQATRACSPSCAAPTLVVQSRNGALSLGAPVAGVSSASGAMTIDDAEFGRLQADSVALYAGDTANPAARGDLQVGQLSLNASAVKALALYAGPANTVRVAGVIAPSAAGTGRLTIGSADPTSGWTPKSIYVTGQIGVGGATLSSPGVGLAALEMNSLQDTLVGDAAFISAITAAEAGTNAAGVINITRGTPVGVQPSIATLNKNLITAGVLTLRSNGYVVQQNTGAVGQQGGILLTNPGRQADVLTLGRVSTSSSNAALNIPALIDLSLNFYDAAGAFITRNVAATSLGIDSTGLSRSNIYRVNGCTIGVAGSCTPLPNTIVDIRIDKLVEGVQISTEEPQSVDDPTITAAGNEEIWRSPGCDGVECR